MDYLYSTKYTYIHTVCTNTRVYTHSILEKGFRSQNGEVRHNSYTVTGMFLHKMMLGTLTIKFRKYL